MKSLKKSLVLLVVLSMVLSVVAPVFAFNDAIPADYEDQVNKIAAMGIVTGDANGNFNAENNITRAEMAKIICRMTGITQKNADDNAMIPSKFSDVEAGAWYTGWINIATNNGIINGFPDGTFRPNDQLTENQALTLIVKALGRGVFVDKAGAWPGNYIQDAHTLGITKDMVYTESELANRGNVAILCYNALTVGTWGVVETRDGEIVSSTDDSLAAKYFQDFVASKKVDDNGTKGEIKYIKLLEDAVVEATALQDKEIGLRQIVIGKDEDTTYGANEFEFEGTETVATAINASKAPRTDKEEATYKKSSGSVVAYVPEDVYAEVTSLKNKRIDVMFGDDNEVVMLIVVDEIIEDSYITAWDNTDKEIEIAGETYEFADEAVVTLYGYELAKTDNVAAENAIQNIVSTVLGIANPNKVFDRTIKADIVVDEDGDIEKIDLTFAQNLGATTITAGSKTIGIEEAIVKSVTAKGEIKGYNSASILDGREVEDVEDEDEPRVIKDGAIASLEDIEAGDVVTAIYEKDGSDKTYELVYVSSSKVEGTISKVKNNAITIDGEVYNTVRGLLVNTNGEISKATAKNPLKAADTIDWKDLFNEEVEVYLNHVGEVAAIIATTEATDLTVGIVTRDGSDRDDNDKGVAYISVKILTKNDDKGVSYKIYHEDDEEDFTTTDLDLDKGDIVFFSANANNVIKSDEIHVLGATGYAVGDTVVDLDGKDLRILQVKNPGLENYDVKKVAVEAAGSGSTAVADGKLFRFTNSTVAFNNSVVAGSEELGLIKKGWDALVNKTTDDEADFDTSTTQYVVVDEDTNRVVYYVASVKDYVGTTNNYGLLADIILAVDEDDEEESIYKAVLYVDGEEVSYEIGGDLGATLKTISSVVDTKGNTDPADDEVLVSEGQFVKFDLSNDKIIDVSLAAAVTTIRDDLEADDYVVDTTASPAINLVAAHNVHNALTKLIKESLTVSHIDGDYIFFKDDIDGVAEITELVVDEDGCMIYDFRGTTPEMFEGTVEDLEGLVIYGFAADCEAQYVDIIVILD